MTGHASPANAQSPRPPWEENPYRLVSLWELVHQIHISRLTDLVEEIAQAQAYLDGDKRKLDRKGRKLMAGFPEMVAEVAQSCALPCSLATATKLADLASERSATREDVCALTKELISRLNDELDGQLFFHLSATSAPLYLSEFPFGQVVAERFPSAQNDIEEAAKCLALNRGTASAFHSIRALEVGVRAFGRASKIAFTFKPRGQTWGDILRPIGAKLSQLNGTLAAGGKSQSPSQRRGLGVIKKNLRFFSETHALFTSAKDAWRDPAMHVERVFTVEQAQRVFDCFRAAMQALSEHIDENGKRVGLADAPK